MKRKGRKRASVMMVLARGLFFFRFGLSVSLSLLNVISVHRFAYAVQKSMDARFLFFLLLPFVVAALQC